MNLFNDLPTDLSAEVFTTLLQAGDMQIERIVSRGHCTPAGEWYDQPRHEWVLVLKGAARIAFDDGSELELAAGDFLDIPAHRRHRVSWTCPERETLWLAIHYRS